jgi:hypothetical protein
VLLALGRFYHAQADPEALEELLDEKQQLLERKPSFSRRRMSALFERQRSIADALGARYGLVVPDLVFIG